jgi:hypothetical protein
MSKNKKAPARTKAKIEYLLTTKLFCGHCNEMMVGVSGTSHTKKIYNYYSCNGTKKTGCTKKNVQKEFIEDLVISEARKVLTEENISKIAKEVVALCEKEKDNFNISILNKRLKENEKQKANLINSLKICDIESVKKSIFEEIYKIDNIILELKKEIVLEEAKTFKITETQIRFFLNQMKKGDINDIKYRKTLIDIFINKIYLYDDKMTITFTTQDKQVDIDKSLLNDLESSYLGKLAQPIMKKQEA